MQKVKLNKLVMLVPGTLDLAADELTDIAPPRRQVQGHTTKEQIPDLINTICIIH